MTTRTRRIAIVCQPWDNIASQSENSIVTVSYQLARCLARDWHVAIYGRRGQGQQRWELDGTIEFKRLKVFQKPQQLIETLFSILSCYKKRRINYMSSEWYHLFYALRVAISIRASKYDVVHVHNFLQFASVIKLFNPRATICLHMHCEWLRQFATETSERRMHKVDLMIGVSDYITEGTRIRFPAIAARCHTVYNGVDTVRFCPSPPQNEGPQRLLFLARVSPEKGVHVLIKAFKILAQSRPTLQLDIVGRAGILPYIYLAPDPDDRAIASLEPFYGNRLSEMVRRQLILKGHGYLDDLVADAAGDGRIVFHGVIPHAETIDLYSQATVMLIPSVWNEPSPLPAYEAAACGLPIVSTRSGGIPEIVEHGRTGLLVARGDAEELALAISEVIDDPALARAMGVAGRQRVLERFTWEASARRLADLIESVSTGERQSQGPSNTRPAPPHGRSGVSRVDVLLGSDDAANKT
jgi:glycosyltransferase involved in cell wall biosynthesis